MPLNILHLEDDRDYSDLLQSLLQADGIDAKFTFVSDAAGFERALRNQKLDIILADLRLPDFDGMSALQLSLQIAPETPFIIISGNLEPQTIQSVLARGATDFVRKQSPESLIPAVRRAVREAKERAKRRQAETNLIRREKYFRALTEHSLDILSILNREACFLFNSPSLKRVLDYEPAELAGICAFDLIHPDDQPSARDLFHRGLETMGATATARLRVRHRSGDWRFLEVIGQNRLNDPEICGLVLNIRDITDRKLAEDELRESERQYRLIFDGNPSPMWVFEHATLKFLEVNEAAVRHYGYTHEEFLKMTLHDLRPETEDALDLIEYVHQLQESTASDKIRFIGVYKHRKKDGTLIDVEIKWSQISFQGRAASLTLANDITERVRAEHRDSAFAKLGQRLSSATTPEDAAEIIKDVADDLFKWDSFSLSLYSAESDEIFPLLVVHTDSAGKRCETPSPARGFTPTVGMRRVIDQGAELISDGQLDLGEPTSAPTDPSANGPSDSASGLMVPIRDRKRVIGILAVERQHRNCWDRQDLTTLQTLADHCGGALDRIRAEQALRSSEMLFHSVWRNSVDGMRLTDENGTIVAVNEAFCRMAGMTRAQLEGQPFTIIYSPVERPDQMRENYHRRFLSRICDRQVERRLTLHNGSSVVLEQTNSYVELDTNRPLLLGLFRDVTAQRRLEDQLRQAQKMEAIGQLAGGVAHDFNNILTVIHGHGSLLLSGGGLSGTSVRSAQQVIQAAERAAALTRQLLTFSRRQVMQPRRLDLNEVVSNMTKMLGRILGEDIALQLRYLPEPAVVFADSGMMEQVLLNLAVNSRDAMPSGGVLTVKIAAVTVGADKIQNGSDNDRGRFICLSTIDTGCGIPTENLSRIFEPFFTTKPIGKGTGLGLATVYGIVKQHQGWVDVESQPGKGTEFRVYLPRAEIEEGSPAGTAGETKIKGGTETILVVEDEAPVRELVCTLLNAQGYHILEAESGVHAMDIWNDAKSDVDLVLTDLVMPGRLNGRELAEKLWQEQPELKILFTSGYSPEAVGRDFVHQNRLHYLQKPYHPSKLAQAVRECLDAPGQGARSNSVNALQT